MSKEESRYLDTALKTAEAVDKAQYKVGLGTDINNILLGLRPYGLPRVSAVSEGKWHASIEMNVNVEGGQFKIATSFNEATPLGAVRELTWLVSQALRHLRSLPNE